MGRSTQGVTLINLDPGTQLASIEKVAESEADELISTDEGVAPGAAAAPEQGGEA